MSSSDPFSTDYFAARRRFLAAAEHIGARTGSLQHPNAKGPAGEPLFMDWAWQGPADAKALLLSLSGTHGAEGLCGSAAQLQCLWQSNHLHEHPLLAVLHVHAVNPFGFAHRLRMNENNVDLNRNWVDFGQPLPENPLYDIVQARFPTRRGFDDELLNQWMSVYAECSNEFGEWAFKDAISRGQYKHPHGVEFGGVRREWSGQALTAILDGLCVGLDHVAYMDWHTLVHQADGELMLLCFNDPGDPLHRRVKRWWGDEVWDIASTRKPRRPGRCGLLMWGLQRHLAPRTDLAGAVVEFCGDGPKDPSFALRLQLAESHLFRSRVEPGPENRRIAEEISELLCPARNSFRTGAMAAADRSFYRALQGLEAWRAEDVAPCSGSLVQAA